MRTESLITGFDKIEDISEILKNCFNGKSGIKDGLKWVKERMEGETVKIELKTILASGITLWMEAEKLGGSWKGM